MDYIYARIIVTMPGYALHRGKEKSYTKTFTEKTKNSKEGQLKKVEFLHKDLVPAESKRIINITRSQYIAMGGQPNDLERLAKDLLHDLGGNSATYEIV